MATKTDDKQPVLSVLASHQNMYVNPYKVGFYLDSQGVITLTCDFPDFFPEEEYTSLSYRQEYSSISALEEKLYTRNRRQLDIITPRFLYKQFLKGKIDVSCYVETVGKGFTLLFRMQGPELFAYDQIMPKMWLVKRTKISPSNFLDFTQERQLLQNEPEPAFQY